MFTIPLYALYLSFIIPLYSHARHDTQNNIELCTTVCADDELIVNIDGWKLTTSHFIEKGYTPVWVELTNKSHHIISMSEASMQYVRPDMKELIELFRYDADVIASYRCSIRQLPFMGVGFAILIAGMYNTKKFDGYWTKAFMLNFVFAVINMCILYPYDWSMLQNLNKKLGGALRAAIPTGLIRIMPGFSAKKLFLVPQSICGLVEFQVFTEHANSSIATFKIDVS